MVLVVRLGSLGASLGKSVALAVVKAGRNHNILAQTPAYPLHKVIWRAYLTDKYYANDLNLSELPELLYAWPQEEFVLRDVMPCFPRPQTRRF